MRRILIDHARAKGTQKRGGGAAKVALELVGLPDLAQDDQPRAMASTLR
jgi:hypothetical protein